MVRYIDSAPVPGGGPPGCGAWRRGEATGGSERRFVAEREIVEVVVVVDAEGGTAAVRDSVTIVVVVTAEDELEGIDDGGFELSVDDTSEWVLAGGVASDVVVGVGTSDNGVSSEVNGGAMSVL